MFFVAPLVIGGCWQGQSHRTLHEVDGQVVSSNPPPPSAYEAYLRARVALEHEPPQLDLAQEHIEQAIRIDPRDPHLWSTRAEIEEKAGKVAAAETSARRALALSPGYPPATDVLARLGAPAN